MVCLVQFQIVIPNPADPAQEIAYQKRDSGRQYEADQDKADPVKGSDGGLTAGSDIVHPASVNADLSYQAAGAHTGGNRGAVHLQLEEAGGDRACDAGGNNGWNPDTGIFDNITHLQHGGAKALGDQSAPFILPETHHRKAYHICAAAGHCG